MWMILNTFLVCVPSGRRFRIGNTKSVDRPAIDHEAARLPPTTWSIPVPSPPLLGESRPLSSAFRWPD